LAIEAYCQKRPQQRQIIFISSAAASVGRCKNSLYGASKAAIDLHLQGLQQDAHADDTILYARAGFIDTKQTYRLKSPIPKGDPKHFAAALFKAFQRNKKSFYFPWFWRPIMGIFQWMPWPLYRRLKKL